MLTLFKASVYLSIKFFLKIQPATFSVLIIKTAKVPVNCTTPLSYRIFRSRTYNTLLSVDVQELLSSEILCDSFGNSN